MKIELTKTIALSDGTRVTESNKDNYVALIVGVSTLNLDSEETVFGKGIGSTNLLNSLCAEISDSEITLDDITEVVSVRKLVKVLISMNRGEVVSTVLQQCPDVTQASTRSPIEFIATSSATLS